jgi:hypothetical protein
VGYLRTQGFTVKTEHLADLRAIKNRHGVPTDLQACHTALVGGYVVWRRRRPGPRTAYRKLTRRRWDVAWTLDEAALAYDRTSDGMYPLLTNDQWPVPSLRKLRHAL